MDIIARLQRWQDCDPADGLPCELCGDSTDAIAEIAALREQVPRWVPVSERLPEPLNSVLYYNEIGLETGWAFYNSAGMWVSGSEFVHEVSHWMELPPPPAEEG